MTFVLSRFMTNAQSRYLITAFYGVLAVLVFAFLAMIILPSGREGCVKAGVAQQEPKSDRVCWSSLPLLSTKCG
jgi:hypothetical protein